MEQNNPVTEQNLRVEAPPVPSRNTLKIPTAFVALVLALLAARVYVKLTQMSAPPGKGVAWITLEQFEKLDKNQVKDKDLVLYDFTADWCPPCQKRERTIFRSPEIINTINTTFIPVRVDLTKSADAQKPDVKQLSEKFDVDSIPRCVITLKSGEYVKDDHWLFDESYGDFLKNAVEHSTTVHAELDLADGHAAEALAKLSPDLIDGKALSSFYYAQEFVMCHHLLVMLNRKADAAAMLKATLDKTRAQPASYDEDNKVDKALAPLTEYMAGKLTEEKLLPAARGNDEKATFYLAIGLKNLREGNKDKALKALHQASLFSAKSYQSDSLAELLTRKLE